MTETTAILRERLLGGAELACIGWALLGQGVLHIFPAQVPLFVVAALVLARLARWRAA